MPRREASLMLGQQPPALPLVLMKANTNGWIDFSTLQYGSCGAITEYLSFPHIKRPDTLFKRTMRCLSHLRYLLVLFMTLLITVIIVSGALVVLLVTCLPVGLPFLILNQLLTLYLSFNVFFNYYNAIYGTPGSVRECIGEPFESGQAIPPGSFYQYSMIHGSVRVMIGLLLNATGRAWGIGPSVRGREVGLET